MDNKQIELIKTIEEWYKCPICEKEYEGKDGERIVKKHIETPVDSPLPIGFVFKVEDNYYRDPPKYHIISRIGSNYAFNKS